MTDHRHFDELSMGLSGSAAFCTTILFCLYLLCLMLLNVLQASSGTNNFFLQVYMAPKQDCVYSRGRSKSVAPSNQMVIGSEGELDLLYVPPDTLTPTHATCTLEPRPRRWCLVE